MYRSRAVFCGKGCMLKLAAALPKHALDVNCTAFNPGFDKNAGIMVPHVHLGKVFDIVSTRQLCQTWYTSESRRASAVAIPKRVAISDYLRSYVLVWSPQKLFISTMISAASKYSKDMLFNFENKITGRRSEQNKPKCQLGHSENYSLLFYSEIVIGLKYPNKTLLNVEKWWTVERRQ